VQADGEGLIETSQGETLLERGREGGHVMLLRNKMLSFSWGGGGGKDLARECVAPRL
jgi:hypothetical protein